MEKIIVQCEFNCELLCGFLCEFGRRTDIEFIKPKKTQGRKVNWIMSEHTRAIVKYYAQYTEYSEDEVVDTFLKKLLKDEDFMEWIQKKRFNKRITDQLLINVEEKSPHHREFIHELVGFFSGLKIQIFI